MRCRLLAALLLVPGVASAGPGEPQLFEPRTAAADTTGERPQRLGVVRERLVAINAAALDAIGGATGPATAALGLNLFDDVQLHARIDGLHKVAGGFSWTGRLEGEPLSDVVLASSGGVLTGSIVWPGGAYRVSHDRRGQFVEQIDQSAFPEHGCFRQPPAGALGPSSPAASLDAPATAADDGSMIDVLVAYTPAARAALGGSSGITSLINTAVTETNRGYENSNVVQRIRLAGTVEVSYTETRISTDLVRLRETADGYIDNVHALRNSAVADLVVLVGDGYADNEGACGVAWLMEGNTPAFASWAFSVVDWNCATGYYSFGHEIGHNMGLNHARVDPTGPGAFSYSYGYKDPSNFFRTVMAYACRGVGACTRILHFSNPNVPYNSRPTGISDTASNSAYNAKSLDGTRVTAANWRATVVRPQLVWHPWFAVDPLETPYAGDFDGDGRTDIITFTRQNPTAVGDVYVALSDGTKFGANTKWHDWFAVSTNETVVIGDYDGDGKDDIATWLGATSRQVYVARSTGSGMTPALVWSSGLGSDPTDVPLAGDVNGDGKEDLVLFARRQGRVDVALSTGSGFAAPTPWHAWFAVSTYERPRVADVTGDGKADIVTFATDSPTAKGDVYVAVSDGTRFTDANGLPNNSTKWHDWFAVEQSQQVRIATVDTDAKEDFFTFLQPLAQCYTVKSLGTSMGPNVLWPEAVAPLTTDVPEVGDVNGDGKGDIIIFAQGEGKVYVSLGT